MSPPLTTLSHARTAVTMTTLIQTVDPYLPNLSKLGHININDSPLITDYWPEDLVQRHVDSPRPNSLYPPIMAWRPWMTLPPRRPDKRPPRRPRPMKPPNFISDYSLSANLRPCPVRPLKKPKPSRKGTSIPKLKVRGKPTLPSSGRPPWTRRRRLSHNPRCRHTQNRIFKCILIPFKIRKYRHILPRNKQTSISLDPHVFPLMLIGK